MKLSSYPERIVDALMIAGRAASEDTANDIRARQARRSGRLAAGTHVVASQPGSWAITSDVAYAGAVEHGANVGKRRGPHCKGNHVVAENGPRFLEHMTKRLRSRT